MNPDTRYTLGAAERLKSRKQIELLFAAGKAFSHFPFRVVYTFNEPVGNVAALQAGFTVGIKHFKKAVNRNRIKRLMKEAYRLQKHPLQSAVSSTGKSFAVFFIYTGNELPEYSLVAAKIETALTRLLKIVHENFPADH